MKTQYFKQLRSEIEVLLPENVGTVMDIGCGTGNTLNWLKHEFGANKTIGVEIEATASEIAKNNCDVVYSLDVALQLNELSEHANKINTMLLLDILEHLENPWAFLQEIKGLLADDAVVIASIPNVRSIKVLGPLVLKGKWTYAESGILDRTHIRFFTKSSSIDLFESSGYSVISIIPNGPVNFKKAKSKIGLFTAILNMLSLGKAEGFFANQYLVSAQAS